MSLYGRTRKTNNSTAAHGAQNEQLEEIWQKIAPMVNENMKYLPLWKVFALVHFNSAIYTAQMIENEENED